MIIGKIRAAVLKTLVVLVSTVWFSSVAMASDITVQNSPELQVALSAALPGDRIFIAPGVYSVALDVTKALTLEGIDSTDRPILDGEGLEDAIIDATSIDGVLTLRNLILQNGTGKRGIGSEVTRGGALYVSSSAVTVEHCLFRNNSASTGGGVFISAGAGMFRDTAFENNSASGHLGLSGGALSASMSHLVFERGVFKGNVSSGLGYGGAVAVINWVTEFYNCLAVGNSGSRGGFLHNAGSDVLIESSTIVSNAAPFDFGGAIYQTGTAASLLISNSILSGNTAPVDPDIRHLAGSIASYFSIYSTPNEIPQGGSSFENNAVDPKFVDPFNGDFRLAPDSPARNSGDTQLVTQALDLAGGSRVLEGAVDRGAFEYVGLSCEADANHDWNVGMGDILLVLDSWGTCAGCAADVDGDGIVGLGDVVSVLDAWGAC